MIPLSRTKYCGISLPHLVVLVVGLSLFSQKDLLELHSSALSPLQQQESDAVLRVAARVLGGGYPVLVTMGHLWIFFVRKREIVVIVVVDWFKPVCLARFCSALGKRTTHSTIDTRDERDERVSAADGNTNNTNVSGAGKAVGRLVVFLCRVRAAAAGDDAAICPIESRRLLLFRPTFVKE